MSVEGALDGYFREAISWDLDRIAQVRRTARTAWRVAAAGWFCSVSCAAALALLVPLKRVEPFLVRVDNSTGIVDVVPVYAGSTPLDETVTRYFLTHYITVCQRFNLATAESDYEECGAFHTARRNQAWYALWTPHNPQSPLNVHRDGGTVRAEVEAVSFFKRGSGISDLAQVRFRKSERVSPESAEHVTHWIATIQYAYAAPSSDPKVRRWNPLGFKIVEFGCEPEVIAASHTDGGIAP